MVSSQVLGMIRNKTNLFLTDTCTIEVLGESRGADGSVVPTWTNVASGVKCRLITGKEFTRGEARAVGEQEAITQTFLLVCEQGTALAVDQRATLSDGTIWHVVSLNTNRTDETDDQAVVTRA